MNSTDQPAKRNFRRLQIVGLVAILLGVGFGIGILIAPSRFPITIPEHIASQTDFSLVLPKNLPDHFTVKETSFLIDEGTVVFTATNSNGGLITFSEQRKPADFNFDAFYGEQLKDIKTIERAPFPSVSGTNNATQSNMVSVLAGDVWVIITSKSQSIDQLEEIARHLKIER